MTSRASLVLLWLGACLALPGRGAAQAGSCVETGGGVAACRLAAVTADALTARVGLVAGGGSEITGTATTLGTRVGGGPRLAVSVRGGAVELARPDLSSSPEGSGALDGWATAVHAEVAAGLFEGIQLMPTVGGFLSVDAFGRATFLSLPSGDGLTGGGRAWTLGARIGVLREGFTVPGVSVSVARRFLDEVTVDGDPSTAIRLDPAVTSLRATVGKDLFAVEWLAGVGMDRLGGDRTLTVPRASAIGTVEHAASNSGDRLLWFAGASTTIGIVLTLAIELGRAEGSTVPAGWTGDFDPAAGAFFGSLSARLTL